MNESNTKNTVYVVPSHLDQPEGLFSSKICLLGESYGKNETMAGRPFVGSSGGVLNACLQQARIARAEVYLTNTFKHPLEKRGASKYLGDECVYTDRGGITEAGWAYIEAHGTLNELHSCGANVIVPLGDIAMQAVLNQRKIFKRRGSIYWSEKVNKKVIPTIHPANVLYGNTIGKYYIALDLRRVKTESEFPEFKRPIRIFNTNPQSVDVVLNAFAKLKHYRRVSIDIETYRREVACIGFGTGSYVIVIPFIKEGGKPYWSEQDEILVWSAISDFLHEDNITFIGQNLTFDFWLLARNNHILPPKHLEDTMVAHHLMYPDLPKGLDFLTSIYTSEPYYKDDGKQWFKIGGDIEDLKVYNAKDVAVTYECMKQIEKVMPEEYKPSYRRRIDTYPFLIYMQLRGIKVNTSELEVVKNELEGKSEEKQLELNSIVGHELNVNSSKQLQQYFYVEKNISPFINRKTGSITVDDKALKRLTAGTKTRPPLKEALLVHQIRGINKLISTYIEIDLDEDKRLHCSYNPAGTTSGRTSSSKTIFGTGSNTQNLPPSFKKLLIPDDNKCFIEFDKVQGEWVITAYLAQDPRMIEIVENDIDAHTETAYLAFGVSRELICDEARLVGHSTDTSFIEKIRARHFPTLKNKSIPSSMSLRQAGKKSNHGFNYGLGPMQFAVQNEISPSDGKMLHSLYHVIYPGIRSRYYKYVEEKLKDNKTLYNLFGRPRRFLDITNLEMFAYIPQSTLVELVLMAMTKIYNDDETQILDVLAHVHDSGMYQAPFQEHVPTVTSNIIHAHKAFNIELEFMGKAFNIKTSSTIGLNWGEEGKENPTGMRELSLSMNYEEMKHNLLEAEKSLYAQISE